MEKLFNIEAKSLCGLAKAKAALRKFAAEEKGASDIVAILVIIVIIIAVAVIFKDRLIELVNSVFDTAGAGIEDLGSN